MSKRNRRRHRHAKRGLRAAGKFARWAVKFVPMTPLERVALIIAMDGIGFMKSKREGE
ncbi:MAG: hypothetical protein IIB38_08105 [Candidatus Hydrogenedentes bacterium]|nr:hypothetical protein [Candidatus Hydrogenedentota bacterium]